MSKKFPERNKLNLSEVNKEVLKQWDEEDVFHRARAARRSSFSRDLPRPTAIRAFTMCWLAALRIRSADSRP